MGENERIETSMTSRQLVIIGVSGAGRRVADIALDILDSNNAPTFDSILLLDDEPAERDLDRLRRSNLLYAGTVNEWLITATPTQFSIGIGNTRTRRRLANAFLAHGHMPATLIAPTARVSRAAQVGYGAVISPGTDISTNATLGAFVHVMANVSVSHDVEIGDYCNVSPGAVISGNTRVAEYSTVGAGATVLQGLRIGSNATIGAGACVVRSVADNTIVKGVPAR